MLRRQQTDALLDVWSLLFQKAPRSTAFGTEGAQEGSSLGLLVSDDLDGFHHVLVWILPMRGGEEDLHRYSDIKHQTTTDSLKGWKEATWVRSWCR